MLALVTSSLTYSVPSSTAKASASSASLSSSSQLTSPASAAADRTRVGTLDVPNLAIGTIAWTPETEEDDARFSKIAAASAKSGLDFFDTAERYGAKGTDLIPAAMGAVAKSLGLPVEQTYQGGDCETNLQRWAAGATVGTKFTPKPDRRDPQSVVEQAASAATRLGVESLDLYSIHMPDIIQPFKRFGVEDVKDEVYWDGMVEAYKQGLVKNVGVSNYGPTLLERCHEHLAKRGVPLASNQIHFNLLYRRQGSLATVQKCNELGVACLAYYPLAMGLLTGKLTPATLRGKTDLRSRELLRYLEGGKGDLLRDFPNTAGDIPAGGVRTLLIALQEVARGSGKTPAQVALNWIICKGAIPIAGAKSVLQVEDNAGALGWRLSDEDVAVLDAAADALEFEFRGSGFQTADSKFVGYGFERWSLN